MIRMEETKAYPGIPGEVRYVIQPHDGDLQDARMMALCRRWMFGQASEGGLVSKSIIETEEFFAVLKNVMLLEIERSRPFQYDYIYRTYGADITAFYGEDMTGRRTSEFDGPEYGLFLDLFDISLTRKAMVHCEHTPPRVVDVKRWHSLVMPLGEEKDEWILVVSMPSEVPAQDEPAEEVYID